GARQRVDELVVGEEVGVHPGVGAGDAQLDAVEVVPPAVGDADHAGPDGVGDLDGNRDLAGAGGDLGRRAVGEAQPSGVVGVHLQRAAGPALHQDLDVVHPRVVRAQV